MVLIGFLTGLTAFGIMVAIDHLSDYKYQAVAYMMDRAVDDHHSYNMTMALL
jgi:hypothetical protein